MSSPVWAFADYADAIETGGGTAALHGGATMSPYEALRRIVPLRQMREKGAFFTSDVITQRLYDPIMESLTTTTDAVIVDPACGAADLLLPALSTLPSERRGTLELRGGDIDADFVRIARSRLHAAANTATSVESGTSLEASPVNGAESGSSSGSKAEPATRIVVEQKNFLEEASLLSGATHVVMNPPYVSMKVDTSWARGTVNAAAVFVERSLNQMDQGSVLLAVLPDVLRAGSRYAQWRALVESMAKVTRVETLGQFDAETDIHVFILQAVKRSAPPRGRSHDAARDGESRSVFVVDMGSENVSWYGEEAGRDAETIGSRFDVRVGPVVPHRHSLEGDEVPFVTARSLTTGETLTRRFKGRLETGPMVLLNRTSRPGESPRARARLWSESDPAAVENHLIVAKPKSGGLEECLALIKLLESDATTAYLDQRIRCRHLTVTAVKDIPWTT